MMTEQFRGPMKMGGQVGGNCFGAGECHAPIESPDTVYDCAVDAREVCQPTRGLRFGKAHRIDRLEETHPGPGRGPTGDGEGTRLALHVLDFKESIGDHPRLFDVGKNHGAEPGLLFGDGIGGLAAPFR